MAANSEGASRPRLFDGYSGAGGSAEGYWRAGFEVVGVDIAPQPNYPFEFHRADVLQVLLALLNGGAWQGYTLADFDGFHCSPPCQARSDLQKQSKREYQEFVPRTRELLLATGKPYVIENVEGTTNVSGAALVEPITLCGTMFPGLRVIRHRLFESNFFLIAPPHPSGHPLVFTHDRRKAHFGKLDQDTAFVQVTGGGNCTVANKLAAMGVPWMTGREANEAIPPAYAEWVGRFLMAEVLRGRADMYPGRA